MTMFPTSVAAKMTDGAHTSQSYARRVPSRVEVQSEMESVRRNRLHTHRDQSTDSWLHSHPRRKPDCGARTGYRQSPTRLAELWRYVSCRGRDTMESDGTV